MECVNSVRINSVLEVSLQNITMYNSSINILYFYGWMAKPYIIIIILKDKKYNNLMFGSPIISVLEQS